jgi:hypothetical protein
MAIATAEEARAYLARWRLVEDRRRREEASESIENRLQALSILFDPHLHDPYRQREDEALRARWAKARARSRSGGTR